jgi:hypothetical protein
MSEQADATGVGRKRKRSKCIIDPDICILLDHATSLQIHNCTRELGETLGRADMRLDVTDDMRWDELPSGERETVKFASVFAKIAAVIKGGSSRE